jgi:hypothetical protein
LSGRPHATLDGDNSESNPGVVVTFAGSVSSAFSATIAHLTITGGYGDGIRVARTVLTLNDSTVTSNIGGGTSNSNQSLILNNSTVSEKWHLAAPGSLVTMIR